MIASKLLVAGISLAAGIAMSGAAQAAPQDNQCWGKVASGLAQFDSPNKTSDMKGGSMGMHSKSTQAANINGGFASDANAFGITFNTENDDGNHGRQGVGNVSEGFPHNTAPGDGGNGQHAVNNGEVLATVVDPATGTFMGGTGEPINCDLDVDPNIGTNGQPLP
jgi:hypothetical protein